MGIKHVRLTAIPTKSGSAILFIAVSQRASRPHLTSVQRDYTTVTMTARPTAKVYHRTGNVFGSAYTFVRSAQCHFSHPAANLNQPIGHPRGEEAGCNGIEQNMLVR